MHYHICKQSLITSMIMLLINEYNKENASTKAVIYILCMLKCMMTIFYFQNRQQIKQYRQDLLKLLQDLKSQKLWKC